MNLTDGYTKQELQNNSFMTIQCAERRRSNMSHYYCNTQCSITNTITMLFLYSTTTPLLIRVPAMSVASVALCSAWGVWCTGGLWVLWVLWVLESLGVSWESGAESGSLLMRY